MLDGPYQTRGQEQDGVNEREESVNRDPDEPKGQQQEPDDGVTNQRKKRKRPANHS